MQPAHFSTDETTNRSSVPNKNCFTLNLLKMGLNHQCFITFCDALNLSVRRFYAGAVQLANLGALTRIIFSGVLLSKF